MFSHEWIETASRDVPRSLSVAARFADMLNVLVQRSDDDAISRDVTTMLDDVSEASDNVT